MAMSKGEVTALFNGIHDQEQQRGKLFTRKEFHEFLPEGLDYDQKRFLIRTWQGQLWNRSMNLLKFQMAGKLRNNVTSKP